MDWRHDVETVAAFLDTRYNDVDQLHPIRGGDWSTAYAFRVGRESFVVRFGDYVQDYEKDRVASDWVRPGLPIPEVIDVGSVRGGSFAISRRLFGEKLDALPPERLAPAIESLLGSLSVIGDIHLPGEGFGGWEPPGCHGPYGRWSEFLTAIPQRDDVRLAGWRENLASEPGHQKVFDEAQETIEDLAANCPVVRKVIHGDLLYGNVLVGSDNEITAIFDWGNSLAGDPLYDIAWLTFWAPWHPGIDPERLLEHASERSTEADLHSRLLCYQLHIALDSMQYQAFACLTDDLAATVSHAQSLL